MKIIMDQRYHRFDAPGISLTRYNPEAEIVEITPAIQEGLDRGVISIKDAPQVAETAPEESEEEIQEREASDKDEKKSRPTSDKKCSGKTAKGTQCKKKALKHSKFCLSHVSEDELAVVDQKLAEEESEGQETEPIGEE